MTYLAENDLNKGPIRNAAAALATVGSMAAGPTTAPQSVDQVKPAAISQQTPKSNYDSNRMLRAIASVESSGGKNTNHKPTPQGTAYGAWALMPDTIKETIAMHPDLKRKHGKAQALQGEQLKHYMQDNAGLDKELAQRHLSRLEHHFGNDIGKLAHSWNKGITGTYKASKIKNAIESDPYSQKVKAAYDAFDVPKAQSIASNPKGF